MFHLLYRNQNRMTRKMEKAKECVPNERTRKTSEINLNKTEISNLADKEFKVIIINMLTKLGRRMDDTVRTSIQRWKI